MTLKETRDGGVFAHILIVLYVFGALAIVCDDYFCASLEIICDGKHPVGLITQARSIVFERGWGGQTDPKILTSKKKKN